MARYCLILATVLLLSACTDLLRPSDPTIFIGGRRLDPPPGWVDYCRRHPDDGDCYR